MTTGIRLWQNAAAFEFTTENDAKAWELLNNVGLSEQLWTAENEPTNAEKGQLLIDWMAYKIQQIGRNYDHDQRQKALWPVVEGDTGWE